MAKILFQLRNVPEAEAQAVRDLLDEHNIPWYETSAGNWGISNSAIWLKEDSDWQVARGYVNELQSQLAEQATQTGSVSFIEHIKTNPLLFILALLGSSIIVYFSISPFFSL